MRSKADDEPIVTGIELQYVIRFGGRAVQPAALTDGIAVQPAVTA